MFIKKHFRIKKIGYSKEYLPDNKLSLFIKNLIYEFRKHNDTLFIIEGD